MDAQKIYDPDTPAALELIGIDGTPLLNGDGTPMTISLLGEDSEVAVAHSNSSQNRRFQQAQRGANVLTAEALKTEEAGYFAKLTTGWSLSLGDETATFSQDAARKLYLGRLTSFVFDQVKAFTKDRKNFLRASQPT